MKRFRAIALTAAALSLAVPVAAQEKSNQNVPFFLEGPAAELAAKMLAICGGASGAATPTSKVSVTVKHAEPNATVTLTAGGIPQATAVASSTGTVRFKFSTKPSSSSQPLDFDPREDEVEIKDDMGTTLASSKMPDGSNPPNSKIDERTVLSSTNAIPGATGKARFRERRNEEKVSVEIQHVPDGDYTLLVNGNDEGTITVVAGRGEIEFSSEVGEGLLLTFVPMGALLQVAQDSTIILSGELVANAPGVNVCAPGESTTALGNTGADADAHGEARLRDKDDCDRDFRVEIEDLDVGTYEVLVGGTVRGTIDVVDLGLGETEGQLEFDTDVDEPGEVLLDFDPVGQTVEIRQGATIFLSSTIGDPGPGTCAAVDVEPTMDSTGADADADGKARFRQEIDCDRDLRVEADDLPVGDYELVVGGVVRGTIAVADIGGGDTEGSIEFDNEPDEPGELLLTFDPRDQLIEIRQGATVYLTITIPS